jgi:hypothetical protein
LLTAGQAKCWLCHAAITAAGIVPTPRPEQAARPSGRLQFGLSSILLFVTLVAILGSIFRMSPGLGIAAAILSIPAVLRTCMVALREGAGGARMTAGDKTAYFLVSVCMVFVAGLAVTGAFAVAAGVICTLTVPAAAASGAPALAVAFAVTGIVAGVAAAAFVGWRLWKNWLRKL